MNGKILVTDSLFIFPEHEQKLKDNGYEIERLDVPAASEEQLVAAIKGKVGYILGGIEEVTGSVIDAADELKAITFTGSDWAHFIPGHVKATEKGIAIANAPGANTYAVAEYTVALILGKNRNIFELGRTGESKFSATSSIKGKTIGIVGMGKIGSAVARSLKALGAKEILYSSRNRKEDIEKELDANFVAIDELLEKSDIVSLHASSAIGKGYISKTQLAKMKDKSLLVNCSFQGAIDADALYEELKTGRLMAAQDGPMDDRFNDLLLSVWFNSNAGTAFNTTEANQAASDMVTESLLSLLKTGQDKYKLN